MRRFLVVAHQTLGSPELAEALQDHLVEGPCAFHLVVPEHHGGGLTWSEEEVRAEADRRLEEARLQFTAAGYPVTGEVGDASPVRAVDDVVRRDGADAYAGVIVSTLPHGVSRWLKLDAPHRIERHTGLVVQHVVGHPVPV